MTTPEKQRRRGRILIALQIVTLILGLGTLTYTVVGLDGARIDSRRQSCHLLKGLVLAAASHSPSVEKSARHFIAITALHNCNAYAYQH